MDVPRGAALLDRLLSVPTIERDTWVDALLGMETAPDDTDLPHGSVPYLPCGVEEILTMVREVPLRSEDTLVDLGSGLGRVVILAHLLTGARALGIEIQEPLVRIAKERCTALELPGVTFVHANVADTELDGSVFFLYAPFNGAMLARVLERLEEAARRRPLVVCTVDVELHVAWLTRRKTSSVSLTVYDTTFSV